MILTRETTCTLSIRDGGDGRTLVGPLLPWGITARVLDRGRLVEETFERGALAGTDPAKVALTATHPRDAGTLPIGVTIELEERDDAAWGAWRVSDTALGNEVLALARDGVPLGLSVGFAEVAGAPAGHRTGAVWSEPGPPSTTWPWSGCRPTKGPGWWASAIPGADALPRPSSPWPTAVGKHAMNVGVGVKQGTCVRCHSRFVGPGDRCQPCQQELRKRKRRKPR